jgi:hypothetical protein
MGRIGPPTLIHDPGVPLMENFGLSHEQLAMVSVVQREEPARHL